MAGNTPRVHARKVSATFIMCGHLGLFALAATGRLLTIVPSGFPLLALVAGNCIWLLLHLVCALMIAASLVCNRWQVGAMSMSAGGMGSWGFLTLLGGLTATSPVSLAGPVLAIAFAATAYSIAMAWAVAPHKSEEEDR
jgi:hypothetical protein